MEHKEIRWNPCTQEWFCVVCGRTSDHTNEEDARVELEFHECRLPTRSSGTKNDVRRSTRLSLQIPVVITSLDLSHDFREECKTVVVNAHGCGVIVHERLKNETPVTVKLISNGRSKKGRIALVISVIDDTSWLLGLDFDSPENFWGIETPPSDWCV